MEALLHVLPSLLVFLDLTATFDQRASLFILLLYYITVFILFKILFIIGILTHFIPPSL